MLPARANACVTHVEDQQAIHVHAIVAGQQIVVCWGDLFSMHDAGRYKAHPFQHLSKYKLVKMKTR